MTDEAPSTSTRSRVPEIIGGYRVKKRLSRGGMGEVWLGARESTGGFEKTVAIKVVLSAFDDREEYRTLFFDEARLVARMNHANLVQVFDFGEDNGVLFLVMEFVDGLSLEKMFDALRAAQNVNERRVPSTMAAHIAAQVARGLHHAHSLVDDEGHPLHVVHRDVSPQNLVISWAGQMKVLDFGIARSAVRKNVTQMGIVRGKPGYMAPEQAKSGELDARTDVFQLGIVLYELLSGEHLFFRENLYESIAAAVQEPVPDLRAKIPDIDPGLVDVVNLCLAKDPNARFQSADALARALDVIIARSGTAVSEATLSDFLKRFRVHPQVVSVDGGGRAAGGAPLPAGELVGRQTGVSTQASSLPPILPRDASVRDVSSRDASSSSLNSSSSTTDVSPVATGRTKPSAPEIELDARAPVVKVAKIDGPTTTAAIRAARPKSGRVAAALSIVLLVALALGFGLRDVGDDDRTRPGDDATTLNGDETKAANSGDENDAESVSVDGDVVQPANVVDAGAGAVVDESDHAAPRGTRPPKSRRPTKAKPTPIVDAPAVDVVRIEKREPVVDEQAVEPVGTGRLTVMADPYAEVTLDGKPIGATPVIGFVVDAGPHVVELLAPDTRAVIKRESFTLQKGATKRIVAK